MAAPVQFNLLLPRYAPIRMFLGPTIDAVTAPLLRSPVEHRDADGAPCDVYPLRIPDGEGMAIPFQVPMLGKLEIGFYCDAGDLVLTLPAIPPMLLDKLLTALGDVAHHEFTNGALAQVRVKLRPGASKYLDLAAMGRLGLEAA